MTEPDTTNLQRYSDVEQRTAGIEGPDYARDGRAPTRARGAAQQPPGFLSTAADLREPI
jgi:hypothetical protein